MEISDQLSLQANLRAEVEDQSSALAGVGDWLSTIREKEARVLSSARASRRVVVPKASAAVSERSGEASSSPLDVLHAEGNAAVAAGEFSRAIDLYTRILFAAPAGSAVANTALANRALCHLKSHSYRAAIVDATDALRADPFHTKSWMRRAAARNSLGQHSLALRDLQVAHALEPANRVIASDLRKAAESAKAASKRVPEVSIKVIDEEN